jgi:hypothetical protein
VEVRREPELGVVGEPDQLVLGLEAVERRHRPEGFLVRDLHRGRDAGQHGGLEELPALLVPLAAGQDLRAFRQRVGRCAYLP